MSEIEGSGVPPSAPCEVTLRGRRLEGGQPGAALTPPIARVLRRPYGNPSMTFVSLQDHYNALAALQDSFVVTLQSASEENPLAVALDCPAGSEDRDENSGDDSSNKSHARAGAGSAFYAAEGQAWRPMGEVRAEGASLAGYRPMLRAHVAAQETAAAPGALQADVRRDLEAVYVRLHAPFALDREAAHLSARLPSGRLVDGDRRAPGERGPFAEADPSGAVFALPLEAGGDYALYAKAEARDAPLTTAEGTFTWAPSVAAGFELGESYPNPARAGQPAHVRLLLLEDARVSVALYDARGRRVRRPAQHRVLAQGPHRLPLRVGTLASGVYFARVVVRRTRDGQARAKTRKLVLVR